MVSSGPEDKRRVRSGALPSHGSLTGSLLVSPGDVAPQLPPQNYTQNPNQ